MVREVLVGRGLPDKKKKKVIHSLSLMYKYRVIPDWEVVTFFQLVLLYNELTPGKRVEDEERRLMCC